MDGKDQKPHIFFLPLMAHGHTIPLVDIAKLFASRNLKVTIITTPLNEPFISNQIQGTQNLGFDISIQVLKFPAMEAGLPEGCENMDFMRANNLGWDVIHKFSIAVSLLQEPVETLLRDIRPDCLVADFCIPWTTDSASKFGIPRLVFHGQCYFAICTSISIEEYEPQLKVPSDSQPFIIPNLPGEIMLSGKQMLGPDIMKSMKSAREAEVKSYGVIVNSFYELEPVYADHYTNTLGRRAWHIGPVSLYNREVEDKARRGPEASIDEHDCLKWLNSKKPNSVVYVCFGSIANFDASQLKEIAIGLESSGYQFIWVIRRFKNPKEDNEDWLPEGFEERMEGKGLVIRGWAPQLLILEHEAIGGFVTHCGWNSTLEGIAVGKPMVTWPIGAEQFFNEKLVCKILKIGVSVGVQELTLYGDSVVKSDSLRNAINQIMDGEEAEEMRQKAQALGHMARKAVEEDGSSNSDLTDLIDGLIKSNFK